MRRHTPQRRRRCRRKCSVGYCPVGSCIGIAGWVLLAAVVLAAPSVPEAAAQGEGAFLSILNGALPWPLCAALVAAIVVAQYLCGLATVTSASRMAFAFARDGGLPYSQAVRWVCPKRRSPPVAIWGVAATSVLFTLLHAGLCNHHRGVHDLSLCLVCLALRARRLGVSARAGPPWAPWDLGAWYRPLALLSAAGMRRPDRGRNAAPKRAIRLGRPRVRTGAGTGVVLPCPRPLPRATDHENRPDRSLSRSHHAGCSARSSIVRHTASHSPPCRAKTHKSRPVARLFVPDLS